MDIVQTTILIVVVAISIIIYPRRDTFIEKFSLKVSYKVFELKIRTKQKNDSPVKSNRSRFK